MLKFSSLRSLCVKVFEFEVPYSQLYPVNITSTAVQQVYVSCLRVLCGADGASSEDTCGSLQQVYDACGDISYAHMKISELLTRAACPATAEMNAVTTAAPLKNSGPNLQGKYSQCFYHGDGGGGDDDDDDDDDRKRKSDHVTPLLEKLHWLPVEARIHYKIATLAFRHFENSLPPYLSELLHTYQPSRTLRSSSEKLLKVPKPNLKSAGNRSFHFQAAKVWNSLPTNIRSSPSLSSFKKNLKTHLFKERFSLGL